MTRGQTTVLEVRDSMNKFLGYIGAGTQDTCDRSHCSNFAELQDDTITAIPRPSHSDSMSIGRLSLGRSSQEATDAYDSAKQTLCAMNARSSTDSAILVRKLSSIPLHVRGLAEKWEIPRSQIHPTTKIGEGQGGVVFKCRWRGLACAAKLLTHDSKSSVAYHNMVNEISTISRLRHPNLVIFLGACTVGSEPLVILSEFMEGGSLDDRFKKMAQQSRTGSWRPPTKLGMRWCMDLSRAVCYLHGCTTPIIHRDLKPANLLLSAEGNLKVSDFGLCKTLHMVKQDGTPYQMTGNTGTRRYMAPEVVKCNPQYNEKVDIYSMAMIFWQIFAGELPFDGVKPEVVAELTSIAGKRPSLDGIEWPDMAALIGEMWAHEPTGRPGAAVLVVKLASMAPPAALLARDKGSNSGGHPGCAGRCAVS